MKVLFLTDSSPDYGADYLYDGLCCLLGPENVVDFPSKPTLHLVRESEARFDCDLFWPSHGLFEEEVVGMLYAGDFDVIVLPTLRPGAVAAARTLKGDVPNGWAKAARIGFDGEDGDANVRDLYEELAGPLAGFFKRELPVGATWGSPLPFGYPARRMRMVPRDYIPGGVFERWGVFYCAHIWEWVGRGMRARLCDALREAIPPDHLFLSVSRDGDERLSLSDYHRQQQRALAAIVPAGRGYWTNRYWEAVADGALVIAEAPVNREIGPDMILTDEMEAFYFETPGEAAERAVWAIKNQAEVREMVIRAQWKLLGYNSTLARAKQLLAVTGWTSAVK